MLDTTETIQTSKHAALFMNTQMYVCFKSEYSHLWCDSYGNCCQIINKQKGNLH